MSATDSPVPATGGPGSGSKLDWPDLVVIVLYFAFVIGIGIWSSRRSRGDISGYFLASRNMHWIPVGASIFATNIGSNHFIGLAGSGAASGIAVVGFEQSAVYILLMLGWLFTPVYMSSGVYTTPEYIKKRFGGRRINIYLSFLSLLLLIFTEISGNLYAGALFIQLALNKSSPEWLYISILILLAIASVFTICGGLTAVMWTDLVQTVLMVFGGVILMIITYNRVGGFHNLVESYPYAVPAIRAKDLDGNFCGEPPSDYMNLLRSPTSQTLPWPGMVFGVTITTSWYWCINQVLVQRTLASRTMLDAKAGCVLAAWLKFLPLWLMVFPGMAARVLFPDRVACADPDECTKICGSANGCTNIAYAELVIELLPTGLAGMMLAVMLAALMSSLTSLFNSASTIFTIDLWTKFRSKASDAEKVIVGRCFVVVLVIISVIWIPVIQNLANSQLFIYLNNTLAILVPPICALYVLAIFWDRTTEQGAFWGLIIGLGIGLIRLTMDFFYFIPACGSGLPDLRPHFVKLVVSNVHHLHFACILWVLTVVAIAAISLMTPPVPSNDLYRLTWSSRMDRRVLARNRSKKVAAASEIYSLTGIEDPAADGSPEDSRVMSLLKRLFGSRNPPDSPSDVAASHLTEEEKAKAAADFLKEDPFWKNVVTVNAIICLILSTFVYGFFA